MTSSDPFIDNASLISAVIPVYNREKSIKAAIQSIISQTGVKCEIIAVDDGSTDATYDVLSSFKDDRITIIRHRYNKGAATARNSAINAAKGHYIAFLDSDDEWLPNKLSTQLEVMEKNNLDITTTDFFLVDSCSIPDDHISPRRSALFMARCVLSKAADGRATC